MIRQPHDPFESAEVSLLNRLEMIAQEVNAGGDVTSILQGIATTVARYSSWPMCWVGLLDVDQARTVSSFFAGFAPELTKDFTIASVTHHMNSRPAKSGIRMVSK